MEEQRVQAQLSQLRRIKPRQDWVLLTKTRIFERDMAEARLQGSLEVGLLRRFAETARLFFAKPALVMPVLAGLVFSGILLQMAQKAVPGDRFYAVRAALEGVQYDEVELARLRLGDLKAVAEANRVQNLGPAIQEFEATVSEASKSFEQLVEQDTARAFEASRQLAELQKGKAEVEQILGTKIGENADSELTAATRKLVERELAGLAERSLTREQAALLEQAEQAAAEEDWQAALQYIFEIGQK